MNKILAIIAVAVLAFTVGCNTADNANTLANASASPTTREGPDNSEITTTTDASGVKTETRVFRNNPRVSRVVVTTQPSGQRTVRVYSASGEEKVVDELEDALDATGDAVAQAAGWTVDKTKDALTEVGDKAEDVGDKAGEVGDKAEDVGDQTVKGAKTVGKKTAAGAKKAGKAIKDAVDP